jgi:energy-coupling factor transporter transmembrane protein EcfT
MIYPRKINLFEKVLLIIGILIIIIGYLFVYGFVAKEGLSWEALQTTFLWLLLIIMIILAAVSENMKEELKIVINNQVKEMRLLREDFQRKH